MTRDARRGSGSMIERSGRSWSGALLDILLIVASILIAFALDAWWDGRQRASIEHEALLALSGELRASRAELDSVIAYNREQLAAARYFQEIGGRDPGDVPLDSLVFAFRARSGGMTFDPSLGATEAIVAAGLPGDPELRARIAAWPGVLREIEADQGFILARYEKLSDALVEAGLVETIDRLQRRIDEATPAEAEAEGLEATFHSVMDSMLSTPVVRQRVSALGRSIAGLLYELDDVEQRLAALEEDVARHLSR